MKQLTRYLLPLGVKKLITHSSFYELRSAQRLAKTSKRIDICASQIAHLLHLSSPATVEGKVCLEVGSGWVLSHALVFHLLGAKKVITTDLLPHAHPCVLNDALKNTITSLPRDILAPFADHALIRERLDNLLTIDRFSFDTLKNIGIEYVRPVDLACHKIDVEVDIVYSFSVLEHVPCEDLPQLLANLGEMLAPGGVMLHAIHLEDHNDITSNPFAFLSVPAGVYDRPAQSDRGNRLRASEWSRLFGDIPQTETKVLYAYHRRDKPLPQRIDSAVRNSGEEDLRVSHLGIHTRKLI